MPKKAQEKQKGDTQKYTKKCPFLGGKQVFSLRSKERKEKQQINK